ncbi:MAG: hypothetical protein ACXW20_14090, partial [Burkholderiales bacterium]
DSPAPLFPSCVLLFSCLAARDVWRRRGLSCGLLAFGLRSCSLEASLFLTSGLLTLRLRLCSRRGLNTSRILTDYRSTLRLQLCRSPSRGFGARRNFLASGLLPFRLHSCCS